MSSKKNIYIFLGKVAIVTLLLVFIVKCFFVESYTISSSQMESTLQVGDRVLINKTAYGVRMPITLLAIPFTNDKYSTAVQLSYKRLFTQEVKKNDIVLFNDPTDTGKPLDKRSLMLGRCIALPGDTIGVTAGDTYVNGQIYDCTPYAIRQYRLNVPDRSSFDEIVSKSNIPSRSVYWEQDAVFMKLNSYEAYLVNQQLPDSVKFIAVTDSIYNYNLLVPLSGKIVDMDKTTIPVYRHVIEKEQKGKTVTVLNDQLYIDGVRQFGYTFKSDYYWIQSDNTTNLHDSRTVGFVSIEDVIGRASAVWYRSGQFKITDIK